ncbi:baseplate wedge tail fiber connector [Synechococcus phage S-MbCM6]|uniref:Baseplate wedge tail fiber connector n=3 Tax=Namakavirus smbcm6 TaxID=2734120 RepID=H8ZMI6_9CAUD|nr:baseplate wedge tail fiber protein connector [Synechococcus phage ACG-2014c]AHB80715.1 baseplate wedge tail fiber [Synechococcus phage S-MbCM25]AFD02697.1 gp10 baseplate wedge subunit protein [Synechococcus phage ACG-2014c]AIX14474.1 baseplate wedge tail fiber connector [Synechococcus phage ACG-2014c]AIX22632.1 baseplate wedge tail fiber connector [Synechococcus phage ACG-2014c]AIX22847.1 baseplate wedge tail fiber connector [Synechococcus phage ACG-2014c]
MSKQTLNVGTLANDNSGDTIRNGGIKINSNFDELYAAVGNGVIAQIDVANAASGEFLRYNGTQFVPTEITELTSNLNTNGQSIVSSSGVNIPITPGSGANVTIGYNTNTATFDSANNLVDFPTKIKYVNQYTTLAAGPAAGDNLGYYYTVNGDDNPYVNINITAGGAGNVKAKLVTEYSSIDILSDVDTTTVAPTEGQVLKWDNTAGKWEPADDQAGISSLNIFSTFDSDSGSTTADAQADTLVIAGGTDIGTAVVGDTLTINYTGTPITSMAALTDTDFTGGIIQGDSLYWNGTDWVKTRSPIVWWELNANGASDYTFAGPGFPTTQNDPTLYVYRGFTYAFDNSVQGGGHPFRLQSTQGLTGTPYTDGQSGSGSNVLYWTVPLNAPNTLYYQCTIHALMNGTINVVS